MIQFKLHIPILPATGCRIGRLACVRAHPWTEDICEEFRRRGFDIYSLPNYMDVPESMRNDPEAHFQFSKTLVESLQRLGGVDLLLSGNATSIFLVEHEGRKCTLGEALGIPTIVWWWDDPRLEMHTLNRCGLVDAFGLQCLIRTPSLHHFMIDRAMADEHRDHLHVPNVHHLPVAACPERFHPAISPKSQSTDLVMIANHYSTEGVEAAVGSRLGAAAYNGLVVPLLKLRRAHPRSSLRDLLNNWYTTAPPALAQKIRSVMAGPWDAPKFKAYHALWKAITFSWCAVRNEAVAACKGQLGNRFQLLGRNWERMGVTADGYNRDMEAQRFCYQDSLLGLNGNHGQLQTGLPYRIWELAMTGTGVVTQTSAELEDYFEPGKEVAAYRCADEAVDQVRRLLREPQTRMAMAAAGHRRAVAHHQWLNRVDQLLEKVELPQTATASPAESAA